MYHVVARLKLLYLLPAFAACLWVSAQAEEYKAYLNGKFTTQEKLEAEESAGFDYRKLWSIVVLNWYWIILSTILFVTKAIEMSITSAWTFHLLPNEFY